MPNGKGHLDCCYCVNFESEYLGADAMYEKGFCRFYKSEIPSALPEWINRICSDFVANEYFEKYLQYNSMEERLSWFESELEPNFLYGFSYNAPNLIKILKDFIEDSE